eukprot:TRINITY_DN423_c0_g1_i2.p1 TRINITY_DN423_c0_g1~~TRINITY_DN423_c0_g1_i2.p1  ORF type:complete len:334 (+),score=76.10 TRINITY_DN423_c0_g1_i2:133-1134(+)
MEDTDTTLDDNQLSVVPVDKKKLKKKQKNKQPNSQVSHSELIDLYKTYCNKYMVTPDPSVFICFRVGAEELKPSKQLQEAEWLPIAEVLMLDTKIKKLNLQKSTIGSNGAVLLGEVLKVNKTLRVLDLSNNKIGPRGALALANALRVNSTVRVLNLHGNRVYLQGAQHLAEVISNHPSLESVDVSNNHIGFPGVTAISNAIKKGNNKIGSANLDVNFVMEEIVNAITHGIGALFSVIGSIILLYQANNKSIFHWIGSIIFCTSMTLLYLSSTLYHSFFKLNYAKKVFQLLDHAGIYILIAGTYTPFGLVTLHGTTGFIVLIIEWMLATFWHHL